MMLQFFFYMFLQKYVRHFQWQGGVGSGEKQLCLWFLELKDVSLSSVGCTHEKRSKSIKDSLRKIDEHTAPRSYVT